MELLSEFRSITEKGKISLAESRQKSEQSNIELRKKEEKEFADRMIQRILTEGKKIAKYQNYFNVMRIDYVYDLNRSEYDYKNKTFSGASKIVFEFCEKNQLNPTVVDIWGDDGMGQDELKGYDLQIKW